MEALTSVSSSWAHPAHGMRICFAVSLLDLRHSPTGAASLACLLVHILVTAYASLHPVMKVGLGHSAFHPAALRMTLSTTMVMAWQRRKGESHEIGNIMILELI